MSKRTIYAAFSTQKGGAGKTTMTVLVASHLHYVKGYNVAVIDCDFPQHSVSELRGRDYKTVDDDEYYQKLACEQITRLGGKGFYPVVESNPGDALNEAERLCRDGDFDFVFFDLPGTINSHDLVTTIAHMDYIFAPIVADRFVLESTLNYLIALRDRAVGTGKSRIKGVHLFWNMVDGREKTDLYEKYDAFIATLGFPVLKTSIPNSLRFRHESQTGRKPLFRSTLFPVDKRLIGSSNIDALTDEILELLK